MNRRALLVAAAIFSVAACSGESVTGLDQMVYNATYVGPATLHIVNPLASFPLSGPTLHMTMTTSQLGQNFSGTFSLADSAGHQAYAGSLTGRTTNAGADLTFVVPAPCAGTVYGSFTVSNGELTGSASGRDCSANTPGNNVQITFTNLVRH